GLPLPRVAERAAGDRGAEPGPPHRLEHRPRAPEDRRSEDPGRGALRAGLVRAALGRDADGVTAGAPRPHRASDSTAFRSASYADTFRRARPSNAATAPARTAASAPGVDRGHDGIHVGVHLRGLSRPRHGCWPA